MREVTIKLSNVLAWCGFVLYIATAVLLLVLGLRDDCAPAECDRVIVGPIMLTWGFLTGFWVFSDKLLEWRDRVMQWIATKEWTIGGAKLPKAVARKTK